MDDTRLATIGNDIQMKAAHVNNQAHVSWEIALYTCRSRRENFTGIGHNTCVLT